MVLKDVTEKWSRLIRVVFHQDGLSQVLLYVCVFAFFFQEVRLSIACILGGPSLSEGEEYISPQRKVLVFTL